MQISRGMVIVTIVGVTLLSSTISATATSLITGAQIKDRSITAADIANNTLTGAQVKNGSLSASDFVSGTVIKGDTGPAGAQGPAGPRGDTGSQGPAGVQGDTRWGGESMLRARHRRPSGACHGATARFFFWERPCRCPLGCCGGIVRNTDVAQRFEAQAAMPVRPRL